MAPGRSAAAERARSLREAEEHDKAAARARRRAAGFGVAARTEPQTARALESLNGQGYLLMHDRHWPGTRSSNLDHIAVGPGGVFIIDTKCWRGPIRIVNGSLFNDDECMDEEVDKVRRQVEALEGVLSEVGLAPLEVVPVMAFAGRAVVRQSIGRVHLVSPPTLQQLVVGRGGRLDGTQIDAVVQTLERECPPAKLRPLVSTPVLPLASVPLTDDDQELQLFTDEELDQQAIEAARRGTIEQWMAFLHPSQAKLVRRSFNGPCRIRGAAGTGKTVVALHRAAYIASRTTGQVLVTTYVKTLPAVMQHLYARLSPETADRVEFTGLHRWARSLLVDRGVDTPGTSKQAETAFHLAYNRWEGRDRLERPDTPRRYWQEEIDYVIRGRGLITFEEYDDVNRVGRRTRLHTAERRLVWELNTQYEANLRERGIVDINDMLAMALRSVQEQPVEPGYVAVLADEVQDLNLLGLQLLHALVGDAPDGLTLVGDGQQAVYPGGFTLAEAGISVGGRSTVLRINYRNTRPILDYATRLVADDQFDDLGAELEQGRRDVTVVRSGLPPVEARTISISEHDDRLAAALHSFQATGGKLSDVAVLVPTNALAARYLGVLRACGLPARNLEQYDGAPDGAIKVGTFKRAKGLEFARVFLPRVKLPANRDGDTEPGVLERLERERREYFVAMTRARDALWVGLVE